MEVKLSGHGIYKVEYHICWITKYRRRILNPGVESYLRKLFPKILRLIPEVEIVTVGVDECDHVHLVMVIPPEYAVSAVIAQIKSQSSSRLRKKFPWLSRVYWKENIVWSTGYFVSTIGIDEELIKRYVDWQGKKDSGQTRWIFDPASL